MTIEKEAEDCVYPENNPMDAFWKSICDEHPCIGEELESIRFRITKALQKKQERILELEEKVREYKWEWESACERERATNERVKELFCLTKKSACLITGKNRTHGLSKGICIIHGSDFSFCTLRRRGISSGTHSKKKK